VMFASASELTPCRPVWLICSIRLCVCAAMAFCACAVAPAAACVWLALNWVCCVLSCACSCWLLFCWEALNSFACVCS
jgi:hypothetical protein